MMIAKTGLIIIIFAIAGILSKSELLNRFSVFVTEFLSWFRVPGF